MTTQSDDLKSKINKATGFIAAAAISLKSAILEHSIEESDRDKRANEYALLGRITNKETKETVVFAAHGTTWGVLTSQLDEKCRETLASHPSVCKGAIQCLVTSVNIRISRGTSYKEFVEFMLEREMENQVETYKDKARAPDNAYTNGKTKLNH